MIQKTNSTKTTTTLTTPETLSLPAGEYRISIPERVTRKKVGLPCVYMFNKWSDDVFKATRQVHLQKDLKLIAEFKITFKESFTLWAKTFFSLITSLLNRFNDFYKKYPLLFWLIGQILARLLNFLKSFKTEHTTKKLHISSNSLAV